MVESILTALSGYIPKIGTLFSAIFEAVVKLFYTAPVAPETEGELTVLGGLALISVAVSLFMFAFNFIMRLIKGFRRG